MTVILLQSASFSTPPATFPLLPASPTPVHGSWPFSTCPPDTPWLFLMFHPPCSYLSFPAHSLTCFHFPSSALQYLTSSFPTHSLPDCQSCYVPHAFAFKPPGAWTWLRPHICTWTCLSTCLCFSLPHSCCPTDLQLLFGLFGLAAHACELLYLLFC